MCILVPKEVNSSLYALKYNSLQIASASLTTYKLHLYNCRLIHAAHGAATMEGYLVRTSISTDIGGRFRCWDCYASQVRTHVDTPRGLRTNPQTHERRRTGMGEGGGQRWEGPYHQLWAVDSTAGRKPALLATVFYYAYLHRYHPSTQIFWKTESDIRLLQEGVTVRPHYPVHGKAPEGNIR
jgi:hypothetical protein